MQLVVAGKVQLDAPVRRNVPEFRLAGSAAIASLSARAAAHQRASGHYIEPHIFPPLG
jgi:CubicO group peptidase (beta-lactamase class C family)